MPGKNVIKQYVPESYYHIYSRGVDKQTTFLSDEDYAVFTGLLRRYLAPGKVVSATRHIYPNYANRLELISYALMPNHIHLFVYQHDAYAIRDFMRSLLTSYCMQYNKIHKRVGPLFQSRYRAVLVSRDNYHEHISRYIHMNPSDWAHSDKSSLDFFTGKREADWIHPEHVLNQFASRSDYIEFLHDYEDIMRTIDDVKWELATIDDSELE